MRRVVRVNVLYRPEAVDEEEIGYLSQALPVIVAKAFNEAADSDGDPEARIERAHVAVYPTPIGRFAVQKHDVAIYVDAEDFPSRRHRGLDIKWIIDNDAKTHLTEAVTVLVLVSLSFHFSCEFEGISKRGA